MLENFKTVELRKLAGQMGIKGMSSARKEQLIPVITEAINALHIEAIAENASRTPTPKAKKAGKRCVNCDVRPIGRRAKADGIDDLCDPCLEESYQENRHSDDAHDAIANGADASEFHGGQETIDRIKIDMESCWVCNPELNEASKEYTPRAGVSRVGQKLHVTLRASGATKAAETIAQLPAGVETSVSTDETGQTCLVVELGNSTMLVLFWDHAGRYAYSASYLAVGAKKRKVRNVSEALRIAAQG